jgi:hypothetical protein
MIHEEIFMLTKFILFSALLMTGTAFSAEKDFRLYKTLEASSVDTIIENEQAKLTVINLNCYWEMWHPYCSFNTGHQFAIFNAPGSLPDVRLSGGNALILIQALVDFGVVSKSTVDAGLIKVKEITCVYPKSESDVLTFFDFACSSN